MRALETYGPGGGLAAGQDRRCSDRRQRKGYAVDRLAGRVALVTGAASGIGAATARRLASEDAAVLVTDVQDDAGAHVAAEIIAGSGRAAYAHLDVTSQDDWEAAVAAVVREFGGLDILVNNAGIVDLAGIEDTSLADWRRTIEIGQTGVFLGMKTAAAALAASGHGSVINISSVFGASGGFGTSRLITLPRAPSAR